MKQLPDLIVHETLRTGKRVAGFVFTDMDKEQAQAIDPYAFKKYRGWFIRAIYVEELKQLFGAKS